MIDQITQRFLEPLNKATRNLLKPINFAKNDQLEICLDDDGKQFVLTFFAISSSQWSYGERTSPSWSIRRLMQRIPQRKELHSFGRETKWLIAGTDFNAILINALWPKDRLEFSDDAKTFYDFLLLRFFGQTENSKIKAAYKLRHELPEMPDDFIDHPVRPLMSHQRVGTYCAIHSDGDNNWGEQGTGKTAVVIAKVCYEARKVYAEQKRMYRALIIVPKNMRMNWHNKFLDFAVRPGKLTVLRGCKLTRLKLIVEAFKPDNGCEYSVVICSYDTVVRSWDIFQKINWDYCAADEAHMMKAHTTKRWKVIRELRDLTKYRSGLTGTPIANNLFDCWTQLEWLGEGLSGFTNFKAFRSYYGNFIKDGDGQREILSGYTNLPLLQERFARLCFQVSRAEALPELPETTYEVIEVEMSKFQRDVYVKLQKELKFEIENEIASSENQQLTANNVLTKLLRLSQITAGYIKWDAQIDTDGNVTQGGIQRLDPNPKLEALIELIKSRGPKEKTIVWSNWVESIHMISERLTAEGIKNVTYYGDTSDKDRQIAQDSYNQDPEVKVFIGNPAAGGVGLDLWGHMPEWVGSDKDHGCNTTTNAYYSSDWSFLKRDQSAGRPVRRGTRVSVNIVDFVVPKAIDEEIACRLMDKKMTAMQLQDVKEVMVKILNSTPLIGDDNA